MNFFNFKVKYITEKNKVPTAAIWTHKTGTKSKV